MDMINIQTKWNAGWGGGGVVIFIDNFEYKLHNITKDSNGGYIIINI